METLIVTERLLACDASVARLSHWLRPLPCCADVYNETSPAHIKGLKLSPRAVAMEITLLRSLIHV